jgi:hypothetical protein
MLRFQLCQFKGGEEVKTYIETSVDYRGDPAHPKFSEMINYVAKCLSEDYGLTIIRADGADLKFIKLHFYNIPMVNNTHYVTWGGDIAYFILNHLNAIPLPEPEKQELHQIDLR